VVNIHKLQADTMQSYIITNYTWWQNKLHTFTCEHITYFQSKSVRTFDTKISL